MYSKSHMEKKKNSVQKTLNSLWSTMSYSTRLYFHIIWELYCGKATYVSTIKVKSKWVERHSLCFLCFSCNCSMTRAPAWCTEVSAREPNIHLLLQSSFSHAHWHTYAPLLEQGDRKLWAIMQYHRRQQKTVDCCHGARVKESTIKSWLNV